LQEAALTGVSVQTVIPDVATKSFKIILSAKVPTGETAKVGWFVVN
jgi:hypothetical protein